MLAVEEDEEETETGAESVATEEVLEVLEVDLERTFVLCGLAFFSNGFIPDADLFIGSVIS